MFASPEEVNRRVLDVCAVLSEQCGGRCPREALGVIASPRGFISGAVSLLLPDSEQLLPLDSVVYPIPGDPEECDALVFAAGSLARCVLVVEKESVFRCADTYDPEPPCGLYTSWPTHASPLCVLCVLEAQKAVCPRGPSTERAPYGAYQPWAYRTHRLPQVFRRLVDDGFMQRLPCLLLTACGFPDYASRAALRRAADTLNVPVLRPR